MRFTYIDPQKELKEISSNYREIWGNIPWSEGIYGNYGTDGHNKNFLILTKIQK